LTFEERTMERWRTAPAKPVCDELARLISTPEGLRVARLLETTGLTKAVVPTEEPGGGEEAADAPEPIGPWQPEIKDGELIFTRPAIEFPVDEEWSSVQTLRPKDEGSAVKRICLLGESVAAGLYFPPYLSLSDVLQQQLDALQPGAFEVINLARKGADPSILINTALASSQLKPDLFVFIAGNNWNTAFSLADAATYSRILREVGLKGILEEARSATREVAEGTMADLGTISSSLAVPAIFVTPEDNLRDWGCAYPAWWLPEERTGEWYRLRETATELLRKEAFEPAADVARRMIELDEGICPASHRILAVAMEGLGEEPQALDAYTAEMDVSFGDMYFGLAARSVSTIRNAQRSMAEKVGLTHVDLPRVFQEYTGTAIQGRRMFLDFCHFTLEGMKVAMAATTAEILRLTGLGNRGWQELVQILPEPRISPEGAAMCYFQIGALYTHQNIPLPHEADLAAYWFEQALKTCPGIAEVLIAYAKAKLSCIRGLLTEAVCELQDRWPLPLALWFVPRGGELGDPKRRTDVVLDVEVVESILLALERCGFGEARQMIQSQVLEEAPLWRGRVDISAPRFRAHLAADYGGQYTDECFYRSCQPSSTFYFISDGARGARLELTARTPSARPAELIRVSVNGAPVGTLDAKARWGHAKLTLESHQVRAGINHVRIDWPLIAGGDAAIADIVQQLEHARPAPFCPIFGEVFTLAVTPA
jgi:hypothetical protein